MANWTDETAAATGRRVRDEGKPLPRIADFKAKLGKGDLEYYQKAFFLGVCRAWRKRDRELELETDKRTCS